MDIDNTANDIHALDIKGARDRFAVALRDYERNRASLFEADNTTPRWGPQEHARREAEMLADLVKAEARAQATVNAVLEASERRRLDAGADPTHGLSESTLDAIGRRRWLVQDECATLGLLELAARVRWAAANGGEPLAWLYGRFASRRWRAESRKSPTPPGTPELGAALRAVGALGARDTEIERSADALRDAAGSFRLELTRAMRAARGLDRRPVSTL